MRKAVTMMCHTCTSSSSARVASRSMTRLEMLWVAIRRRRLSTLSAMTPPMRFSTMAGRPAASPTYPRNSVDPVSSYTSHPWATVII